MDNFKIKHICASGWFVGLMEKHKSTRNIITITFKSALKTFETEILQTFKKISVGPKIRRSYKKNCVKSVFPITPQFVSLLTPPPPPGGYSIYSDDRDDRRIF